MRIATGARPFPRGRDGWGLLAFRSYRNLGSGGAVAKVIEQRLKTPIREAESVAMIIGRTP
jgi:hypothetical protein